MCITHFWYSKFIMLIINPLTFAVIVSVLCNCCLIISCLYNIESTFWAILCITLDVSSNMRTNTLYFTWNTLIYTYIEVHYTHVQYSNTDVLYVSQHYYISVNYVLCYMDIFVNYTNRNIYKSVRYSHLIRFIGIRIFFSLRMAYLWIDIDNCGNSLFFMLLSKGHLLIYFCGIVAHKLRICFVECIWFL